MDYVFKYCIILNTYPIFYRKTHFSRDRRKTKKHNQLKSQLIDTIAIHMSVNVYIKSQRISNIHKNIVTYLIKLLHTGECYMKLYSTDKNYRIIGIIVHNQKNDMHNVHACLDSKNFLQIMFLCSSMYYCLCYLL